MSTPRLRLAVIVGSTREGRFGPTVASWLAAEARAHGGFDVDVIDLAATPVPEVLTFRPSSSAAAQLAAISPRLAEADAFVIVTPEYNHSYPAPLKAAIDWHSSEWHAKPIGFVSYGGVSGGLRAVEHLRQVFAELHAVTVRTTVSFHGGHAQFGADGKPLDATRASRASTTMLEQIQWWGLALRDARVRRPYAA